LISFVSAGFWSNFFAKITGNPVSSSNNTCSDGDLGIDIYHTTEVSNTTITYQDKCVNDSSLIEYYCDESNVKSSYHSCPVGNSCLFGRCVSNQICRDIDSGLNMFVKATCRDSSGKQFSDSCSDIIYLKDYACTSETAEGKCVEYSIFCSNGCVDGVCLETIECDADGDCQYAYGEGYTCQNGVCLETIECDADGDCQYAYGEGYTCQNGVCLETIECDADGDCQYAYGEGYTCQNGVCLETIECDADGDCQHAYGEGYTCQNGVCLETIKVVPNEETGPINLPDISFYGCSGCVEDKKCYPFGYRKGGEYCSDNFYFIAQLKEKSKCDNNFECTSNSCVSGQCVSEGLLKKILNWFKKIF